LKCLRDFIESQMSFYAQAHQHMAELQRELSGAPIGEPGIGLYSSGGNSIGNSIGNASAPSQQIGRQQSSGSTTKDSNVSAVGGGQ
uniref:Meis_PKNOX_N domain-containing protein n=1 Tax=Gongylonema pulchrum TaxID=637853 RepID=A0A183ER33_9BILA